MDLEITNFPKSNADPCKGNANSSSPVFELEATLRDLRLECLAELCVIIILSEVLSKSEIFTLEIFLLIGYQEPTDQGTNHTKCRTDEKNTLCSFRVRGKGILNRGKDLRA